MILDTNAVSAILAGNAEIARLLDISERHHLPWIVLGEYDFGILGSRHGTKLRRLFRRLETESHVLWPDRKTVELYAAVRHELKRKGRPIPENDVWIAAAAKQYDLPIASMDTHFDFVDGVTRLAW